MTLQEVSSCTSYGFQVYLSMHLCVHDVREVMVDLYRAHGRSNGGAFGLKCCACATGIAKWALRQVCPWL